VSCVEKDEIEYHTCDYSRLKAFCDQEKPFLSKNVSCFDFVIDLLSNRNDFKWIWTRSRNDCWNDGT